MKQNTRQLIKKLMEFARTLAFPLKYVFCGHAFPKRLRLTPSEAESILSSIHPDKGGTCLCTNEITPIFSLHIIVPVYNTKCYLKECLDSIFSQETQYSFLVSAIDDGSSDGSSQVLDDYQTFLNQRQHRGRLEVIHQENQGPSVARNTALSTIKGEYVMFVDSDDFLLPGAIESLMNAAIESGADIAEGNFNNGPSFGCACGKVYRSQLFKHVHFPPGYWFEDTINIYFLYPLSKKTIYVPGVHYYYSNNPSSIMHSFGSHPRVIDSLWVSRRVLTDWHDSGHETTISMLRDFLLDALSTKTHLDTLRNEDVMQALFVCQCGLLEQFWSKDHLSETASLPYSFRLLLKALVSGNYRAWRLLS